MPSLYILSFWNMIKLIICAFTQLRSLHFWANSTAWVSRSLFCWRQKSKNTFNFLGYCLLVPSDCKAYAKFYNGFSNGVSNFNTYFIYESILCTIFSTGPEGFEPSTNCSAGSHSIQTELWAQTFLIEFLIWTRVEPISIYINIHGNIWN